MKSHRKKYLTATEKYYRRMQWQIFFLLFAIFIGFVALIFFRVI